MRTNTERSKDALTEIEGSVLGMISRKGPCTAYALRREFTESPSQYWSASSGAVYPLVRRLERRRLIRVKRKTRDGREGSLYVLTAAGHEALTDWLNGLDATATISVPPDPLRNRVAFFALLEHSRQQVVVARAIEGLRSHLERVLAHTERLETLGRTFEYLVSDGARRMLESRLEWLLEVARATGGRGR